MNAIKILIEWVIAIVVLPVMLIALIVASYKCDDYEWEGIGYDD